MNILKSIILLSAFSVFAHQPQSTFIITNDAQLGTVIGFSDSSFNYDVNDTKRERQFCFVGNVNEVCAQIEQASFDMNGRYYQGSHDRIELLSCEVKVQDDYRLKDFIETTYNLSDDYESGFTVTRKIETCLKN